jgi:hypothetical protein
MAARNGGKAKQGAHSKHGGTSLAQPNTLNSPSIENHPARQSFAAALRWSRPVFTPWHRLQSVSMFAKSSVPPRDFAMT